MDGDLQNDPTDIPRLLAKLDQGFDVVSGWRKGRKDAKLTRNMPSWFANKMISWISGVHLHDYGCSLKAYHKSVDQGDQALRRDAPLHPDLRSWQGARVTEIRSSTIPRLYGKSKYGSSAP
jgi:hypothetical protein